MSNTVDNERYTIYIENENISFFSITCHLTDEQIRYLLKEIAVVGGNADLAKGIEPDFKNTLLDKGMR